MLWRVGAFVVAIVVYRFARPVKGAIIGVAAHAVAS